MHTYQIVIQRMYLNSHRTDLKRIEYHRLPTSAELEEFEREDEAYREWYSTVVNVFKTKDGTL